MKNEQDCNYDKWNISLVIYNTDIPKRFNKSWSLTK